MRDLGFLVEPHEPQESPGLDSTDEQLSSISELVDEGDFSRAADRVADLVEQDVYDVRLLVFLFYGAFLEEGFGSLTQALEGFATFLEHSKDALGPASKREAHVARSLRWLLEHVADATDYEERKKTERWTKWVATLDADVCARTQAAVHKLNEVAGEKTQTTTMEATARLLRWLRDASARLEAEEEPEVSEPEDRATPTPAPPATEAARHPQVKGGEPTCEVRGSVKLVELIRKLEAFERLVGKRSFEKAALVSDDVLQLLDSFDPREYFPDLFSEFGALLSSHVEEITPHWEHKDSVRWRMLEQFYKVDLSRFEEER